MGSIRRKKYSFISCLLKLPIHGITISKGEFTISGKNGVFPAFQNDHLYNYDDFVSLIKRSCIKTKNWLFKIDENTIAIIWNSSVTIKFENAPLIDIDKYFYTTDEITNSKIIHMVDNGVIISAPRNTDGAGFLQSLAKNSIYPGDMILFICHDERIKINNVKYISFDDLLSTRALNGKYKNCVNEIGDGSYKLLIISLKVALEAIVDIDRCIERLEVIIKISKQNNMGLILITDCMTDRFYDNRLTRSFLSHVKYQIELNFSQELSGNTVSRTSTFVSKIRDLSSDSILYEIHSGELYSNPLRAKNTGPGWVE